MKYSSKTPGRTLGQKSIPEAKMGGGMKSSGKASSGGKAMNADHLSEKGCCAAGRKVSC